jgi:hypothetical protein
MGEMPGRDRTGHKSEHISSAEGPAVLGAKTSKLDSASDFGPR